MPRGSLDRRRIQHLFHGQSLPTSVDETGRIVIPARQRDKIGLESEAFFIAAGDKFQIWKPETYTALELERKRALAAKLRVGSNPRKLLSRGAAKTEDS